MGDRPDAVWAVLQHVAPDWLHDELAVGGLQLDLTKSGAWIISPLDG